MCVHSATEFDDISSQKSGIPVPLHIIVDRDSLSGDQKDPEGFVETEDYVELNGIQCLVQDGMHSHAGIHMDA